MARARLRDSLTVITSSRLEKKGVMVHVMLLDQR